MRKTHWLCLTLGVSVGFVAGVLLVILQLKYGSGSASGDLTAQADTPSVLEEPKPLGESSDEEEPGDPAEPEILPPPSEAKTEQSASVTVQVNAEQPGETDLSGTVAEGTGAQAEELPMPPHPEPVTAVEAIAAPVEPPTVAVAPAPAPIVVTVQEEHKPATRKRSRAKGAVPYTGNYDCTLDEQGGLTLPAEVHEMLATPRPRVLYVAPAADQGLWLFTASGLRRFVAQRDAASASEKEEKERRLWFSKVAQVDVAANGQFQIPADLIDEAGLQKDLVLVGINDHFEIWDADRWDAYANPEPSGGTYLQDRPKDVPPSPDYPVKGEVACTEEQPSADLTMKKMRILVQTVLEHLVGETDLPVPVNQNSTDPASRKKELLNGSDDSDELGRLEEERERTWNTEQPTQNPQRIHGGIQ